MLTGPATPRVGARPRPVTPSTPVQGVRHNRFDPTRRVPPVPQLTLLPATLAEPGYRFVYRGDGGFEECDGCPVRGVCYRLTPGRRYQVETVRDVEHPCGLHDEARVRVCTVQEVPLHTSLETKHLRGTAAHWSPVPCGYPECKTYKLCHPVGAPAGRYAIAQDAGPLACPMGYDLHRVTLEPLDG